MHPCCHMARSDWLPQHAAQLQRLRCAAGLDVIVLAKKHLISPRQLEQLENGGDSSFYSAQIKFNIGRKLVQSLGENLVTPDPDDGIVTTHAAPAFRSAPTPDLPGVKTTSYQIAPGTPFQPQRTPRWLWMALLALLILTPMVFLLPSSNPPRVDVRAPVNQSATPLDLVPSPILESPNGTQQSEAMTPAVPALNPGPLATLTHPPGAHQSQTTPPTVAEKSTPVATPSACHWGMPALDLTPGNDDRRTHYIHLVGLQAVTLCWRDAQRQSETVQLQPGEALTLTGQPPFSISSANPDRFSLYYKGQRVRWPEAGTAHFILQAR